METTFKIVTVIITAVMSSSSFAAVSSSVAHAEHAYGVAEHNYHAAAYQLGNGVNGSAAEALMNKAGEMRAQAYANARVADRQAEAVKAAADKTAAQVANPTPHLDKPDVGAERAAAIRTAIMQRREQVAHIARFAGMNPSESKTGSINVDSGSLLSNTPVETESGLTTAGQLPAGTQVSIPHIDAIISSPNPKSGHNGHSHSSGAAQSGNGEGNAAGTASAHGMGGGSHIGGGSAMAGGFHGSW